MPRGTGPYVSRAGVKLRAALDAFEFDVGGLVCADFGSHVGGFVDCLLRASAQRIYAVDPGYGVLDAGLRTDPRVRVCERTNAMDFTCPEPCDLVTIDVGWTPQRLILPAAQRCLKPQTGRVITLVKPQYEAPKTRLRRGVLPSADLAAVLAQCRADVRELGWRIGGQLDSPIRGRAGNAECLWFLIAE